jgi:DNA-3-methyladenine glycosylase II
VPAPLPLTDETLAHAVRVLAKRDPDLGAVVKRYGPPPMWARRPGFATLIHIILEQQVSLASAKAAFNKLRAAIAPVTPIRFMLLDDVQLKAIGFSRQKTLYARYLAMAILEGRFSPKALAGLDDMAVRESLVELKGIGRWTSDIYLLMCLRRPNVWPAGDLALAVAAQKIKQLPRRPTPNELDAMAEAWHPWRAVAARVLWHFYLSEKRYRPAKTAQRL